MAHNVESFIETLRTDGVEAGRLAAEKIRSDAQQQAEQRIREAEAKAQEIVEEAERQRQIILQRGRTDLELAARDTVAQLRDALNQTITNLLARAASAVLGDDEFLKALIRDIVTTYVKSDAIGEQVIEFRLPEQKEQALADWVIKSFHHDHEYKKLSVELHGMLSSVGFEYKLNGGTVEVTRESVSQVLLQFVASELEGLIDRSYEAANAED